MDNQDRRAFAFFALEHYAAAKHEEIEESTVMDLIVDLLHYASHEYEIDPEKFLNMASLHYWTEN